MIKVLLVDDSYERHSAYVKKVFSKQADNTGAIAFDYNDFIELSRCYTAAQAIALLQGNLKPFDGVLLDHDLGMGESGMDVAKYICSMPNDRKPKSVRIHSHNVVASKEMYLLLRDYGVNVSIEPWKEF